MLRGEPIWSAKSRSPRRFPDGGRPRGGAPVLGLLDGKRSITYDNLRFGQSVLPPQSVTRRLSLPPYRARSGRRSLTNLHRTVGWATPARGENKP